MRLVAGYVLLAAIASLLFAQDRFPERTLARQATADVQQSQRLVSNLAQRRMSMDAPDRLTTVFDGPEIRTAAALAAADVGSTSSARSAHTGVTSIAEQGIQRLEGVIQQYPWPTVILGIGVGFLLARSVR